MNEANRVGDADIVIGLYYEDTNGQIARTTGWSGPTRLITYHYDDGEGSRTIPEADFLSWKIRRDLNDFPNARDPKMPSEFDLFWDIKYRSQLVHYLKHGEEKEDVLEAMKRHGIEISEEFAIEPAEGSEETDTASLGLGR